MKVNIKKISKKIMVLILVFAMSLGTLSVTASAETGKEFKHCSFDKNNYYCTIIGASVKQIKPNTAYLVQGGMLYTAFDPIYVTAVEKNHIEGINMKTGEKISKDSDKLGINQWELIKDDDESISCRGVNYYKNKFGERVDQYAVKENTPYILLEEAGVPDTMERVYVQRVFEDPMYWGIFGTTERKVEGIDLDTGKTVVESISKAESFNVVHEMIRK